MSDLREHQDQVAFAGREMSCQIPKRHGLIMLDNVRRTSVETVHMKRTKKGARRYFVQAEVDLDTLTEFRAFAKARGLTVASWARTTLLSVLRHTAAAPPPPEFLGPSL